MDAAHLYSSKSRLMMMMVVVVVVIIMMMMIMVRMMMMDLRNTTKAFSFNNLPIQYYLYNLFRF